MFQNKGSTRNATPWPWPAWKGWDLYIKRPQGRTRPRGQASASGSRWRTEPARGAPSPPRAPRLSARAARLPGAREPRPTFLHARQLGLIYTHVGHGGRSASGARRPRRTPTPRAGPGGRRTLPGRKCTGVQYGEREESERRRPAAAVVAAGGGGCKAAPHAEAREPHRLPSPLCLPRPTPATALRPEGRDPKAAPAS